MPEVLGLIAGDGGFPREIACAAVRRGCHVHAVGFHGLTRPDVLECASDFSWHHLGQVDALLDDLRLAGVSSLVMAGKIEKTHLTAGQSVAVQPDGHAVRILENLSDWSDRALMNAIADLLEREGFSLRPQAEYVPELLASGGLLGGVLPSRTQRDDIAHGWPIARQLANAGVGQCIVLKNRSVVAVEASEGTDATIQRAVELAGGGLTVIKLAAFDQDPRFDLPAVGPDTLAPLLGREPSVLAIEAHSTLVLQREEMTALADAQGIALLAVDEAAETGFNPVEGNFRQ